MTLSLLSCRKDKDDDKLNLYEGTWEMKSSVNGLNGVRTDYSSGNGNIIILSGSSYEIFSNHQPVTKGTFQIVQETSILTNAMKNRIIYDNSSDVRTFIEKKDNNLTLFIDAYDGPSTIYVKK
ncbi:hypothetical protein DU508_17060 [Pedobacter chinensis]|uniref:META domain-containing protein n=2 Tax=Pedobacter chinensis TaxID=2282421 RepID=A0A369PRX7_9SPHI|nr:hypothetical protein DU508_17060 [Pedobacter chinensis]